MLRSDPLRVTRKPRRCTTWVRPPSTQVVHDPRFPYVLYVPPEVLTPGNDVQLVVVMHGTGRQFTQYRDAFAPFGRWNRCIVLCPLFPVGVRGDGDRNGFKRLIEGDIRYDKVLLDMVSRSGRAIWQTLRQVRAVRLFGRRPVREPLCVRAS
jgi:hypothetical protein